MINYNQAMEALDKERQFLLNREQYGAEDVIVKHAINVIAELPIIRQPEIVRCKDCKYWRNDRIATKWLPCSIMQISRNWYCADGERA